MSLGASSTISSEGYCRLSVEETARRLHTSPSRGLESPADASYRRSVHGPNILKSEEDESLLRNFIAQFYEDPLILMLIASAIISLILGNKDDALSIIVAIVFVVSVGFVQEYRSEKSLKALNTLVPPTAHLIRGGTSSTTLAANLVPGDLVQINVGDRVPADIRLVKAVHLAMDESMLTGETHPVEKSIDAVPVAPGHTGPVPVSERSCIAFMGTLVSNGHGVGIVVGISQDTEFGTIYSIMSEIDKPKTPLQLSMDKLGRELSIISFGVIGVICIIGLIQGRKLLEMFQIGVSLAVAAIPEGLPVIVTVTLALGVLRMAKSNAIIRRLPSVETLGSVNVICSDKTGTLTCNKLTCTRLWVPSSNSWVDAPTRAKGLLQTVQAPLSKLLEVGMMCNNARAAETTYIGNPVDVALLDVLRFFDLKDQRGVFKTLYEVPFNSQRKYMAVASQNASGDISLFVKGALERVLPMCTHVMASDGIIELSEEMKLLINKGSDEMACEGMRILAMAFKPNFDGVKLERDPEGLCFAGLAALSDPPRPGVRQSIQRLHESSVRVVMITGDNELTAAAAARSVGIPIPTGRDAQHYIITGPTLETLTPEQLSIAISNILVFARTSPEMKVKIVRSLQLRGDIVAMTGDGVNDAPALKLADIGVAMGSGTDVAKEAGDMILIDDDFSTILDAIREGKSIFSNIKSFLSFQLSTSVAALSLIVVSTIFRLPNPLNPMQILWINILMDGPPAQSLGVEAFDPEEMRKPPRSRNDHIMTLELLYRVALRGMIILAGTMYVYLREMHEDNQVTARDTTMSFTCFVLFDLFNALASRSARRSIFELGLFSNKMFNVAVGLSLLGQLCVIYFPPAQRIFQTEALSMRDMVGLVTLTSSIWWTDEIIKCLKKMQRRNRLSRHMSLV